MVLKHGVTGGDSDLNYDPAFGGADHVLHFHGIHNQQGLPRIDLLIWRDINFNHSALQWRANGLAARRPACRRLRRGSLFSCAMV